MAVALLCTGCSLVAKSTRPVPGAQRNLYCSVEYRPGAGEGPDLLFFASAVPYKVEEVYMSLPDVLVHQVFAPGRHLTQAVEVQGATCDRSRSGADWGAGFRVPMRFNPENGLRCTRTAGERVAFVAETRHGRCEVEISPGEMEPRCHHYLRYDGTMFRTGRRVQSILGRPCAVGSRGIVRSSLPASDVPVPQTPVH